MQANEHAGQVQKTTRLPDIDRVLEDTAATLETRAKRMSAEQLRRPSLRPPAPKPGRYGAGF